MTTDRPRLRHTVAISDDVWERWQKLTGLRNPASVIREKVVESLSYAETLQNNVTTTSDFQLESPRPKPRLPEEYDVGQLIRASKPWQCARCHEQEPAGTDMVIYTTSGPFGGLRGTEHPNCRIQTVLDETGVDVR